MVWLVIWGTVAPAVKHGQYPESLKLVLEPFIERLQQQLNERGMLPQEVINAILSEQDEDEKPNHH